MAHHLHIRDVDDTVYTALRERAAAEGLSLSQFLRRELAVLAATPTGAAWLDRVEARRRRRGGVDRATLDEAVEAMRNDRR